MHVYIYMHAYIEIGLLADGCTSHCIIELFLEILGLRTNIYMYIYELLVSYIMSMHSHVSLI